MTPAQVSDALENWGNWCMDQHGCWPQGYPASCVSAEARYCSPQCWESPQPRVPIIIPWAERVEDAIHTRGFLLLWRKALIAEFVLWPAARLMDAGVKPDGWADLRAVSAMQAPKTYEDSLRRGMAAVGSVLVRMERHA